MVAHVWAYVLAGSESPAAIYVCVCVCRQTVCLAVPDLLAQQLQSDFLLVSDIAKSLPADSALGCKALYVANSMINTFR